MGKRTLLIDADMRSPRQHELFGLDNKTGLSTMLAGRTAISAGGLAEGFRTCISSTPVRSRRIHSKSCYSPR